MNSSSGGGKAPTAAVSTDQPTQWASAAARAAADKLGHDTLVIAVGELLAITDHFVITSGANRRQVKAITQNIEEQLTLEGGPKPLRIEGLDELGWVLMDFGSFVVHVFDADTRSVYDLERLWGDCPTVAWEA